MKNKIVFISINALLILAVGLIIGLLFPNDIFSGAAGMAAFVCLLVVLAIPSLVYVLNSKINLGGRVVISLFTIFEIALNIVYLCIPKGDIKIYAIIQVVLIVIVLASFLIILGLFKDKESKEHK